MAWHLHDTYCNEEHLSEIKAPHCISTKNAGNMKDFAARNRFFKNSFKYSLLKPLSGQRFFSGKQVHGNMCQVVNGKEIDKIFKNTDGLCSADQKSMLGIYTADCIPVFIADTKNHVVALVHAGWRGITKKIVSQMFALMSKTWGIGELHIAIGPHLKSCCYEVTSEMKDRFPLIRKSVHGEQKFFIDMEEELIKQIKEGYNKAYISQSNYCTGCDRDKFFSYRFDSKTDKRMLSVISI